MIYLGDSLDIKTNFRRLSPTDIWSALWVQNLFITIRLRRFSRDSVWDVRCQVALRP